MKKYVELCLNEIERETEKAILVEGSWIPKSQLIVVFNNADYNLSTKTVKEYKEKTIYCLLLPLWLQMKNNFKFKKSFYVEEYMSKINVDRRYKETYEAFKYATYVEYKEMIK